MPGYEYVAPAAIADVLGTLSEVGDEATVLAGSQSLMILLRQRLVQPRVVVSLPRVASLAGVDDSGGGLRVGAMTSYADVAAMPVVRERAGIFARAAGAVCSVHIRNRGTIGGSICHADPAGDVPTVLLALGADLLFAEPDGTRTAPVDGFFTGFFQTEFQAGELLVGVEVPVGQDSVTHGYRRFSFREGEYPLCVAAVVLRWDGSRCTGAVVAVGGAGDRPLRLAAAEEALVGAAPGVGDVRDILRGLRDAVDPVPDVRGSSEWKARVVEKLVIQAVEDAVRERVG